MILSRSKQQLWIFLTLIAFVNRVHATQSTLEFQFHKAVGERVILPCHTTLSVPVDWRYHWSPLDSPSLIYSNNQMYDTTPKRYNVTHQASTGDYSLIITDVQTSDTGLYTCIEDAGLGTKHTISLLIAATDSDEAVCNCNGYVIALIVTLFALAIVLLLLFAFVFWPLRQRRQHHTRSDSTSSARHLNITGQDKNGPTVRLIPMSAVSSPSSDVNENNITTTVPPTFELLTQTKDQGSSAVRGLCIAGDVLYVARDNQSTVEMYNRHTMQLTDSLQVSDDKHPTCMAIDKKSAIRLYISYEGSNVIRNVEIHSKTVTHWITSSEPSGLAVILESSNVIVALKMVHKLTEYKPTTDGATIVREFNLTNIWSPRFITPFDVSKFKFVVCYGEPGKPKCGVAIYDTSSSAHYKRIETKSTYPVCAAVGANDFICIADSSANSVALFDNTNYVNDAIPANDGVNSPSRLSFDDKCETLYVGESAGDCRVLAYKLG